MPMFRPPAEDTGWGREGGVAGQGRTAGPCQVQLPRADRVQETERSGQHGQHRGGGRAGQSLGARR